MGTTPNPPKAEFDAYARGYDAGMDNPVKALLGDSADDFVAIKLRWLKRQFPGLERHDASFRILDYGCGIATLLRLMAQTRFGASLLGCDTSSGMLDAARLGWPSGIAQPRLHKQDGARTPLADTSIDLAVVSAVLHHVMPHDRPSVYSELERILRPGGSLVVFEHNPLNPVTRFVVSRTPIDANAILLRAGEVCDALRGLRFTDVQTRYIMFLPPRLSGLAAVEGAIGWLPLGAQYAVVARRV